MEINMPIFMHDTVLCINHKSVKYILDIRGTYVIEDSLDLKPIQKV